MAIIPCEECGKEVSTKAPTCPHCGYPRMERYRTKKEKVATKPAKTSLFDKATMGGNAVDILSGCVWLLLPMMAGLISLAVCLMVYIG